MAKILIGVPSAGEWQSVTAESLLKVFAATQQAGHQVALSRQDGSLLPNNRNALVQKALDNNFDYLFFADSDMIFHPNTVSTLVAQQKQIIGLNYLTRGSGRARFTAVTTDDKELVTSQRSAGNQRALMIATGAMLIDARVLADMRKRQLKLTKLPDYPWFNFAVGAQGKLIGEDFSFCYTATQMGYEVWINHDMSKHVMHLAQVRLGYQQHGLNLDTLQYENIKS